MKRKSAAEEGNCGLLILARNPIFQKTKTRLAADLGDSTALAVYEKLVSICQQVTMESRYPCLVFYSDFIDPYDGWQSATKFRQIPSDDLGMRITTAIAQGLALYDRVLVIGSDCPDIDEAMLDQACAALSSHDVAIGPAADGGFYLLGVKTWNDLWFEAVEWGSDSVFEQIKSNISKTAHSIVSLPVLRDIDTMEDWQDYLARNPG